MSLIPKPLTFWRRERKNGGRSLKLELQLKEKPSIKRKNNKKIPSHLALKTFRSLKFITIPNDLYMKYHRGNFRLLPKIFIQFFFCQVKYNLENLVGIEPSSKIQGIIISILLRSSFISFFKTFPYRNLSLYDYKLKENRLPLKKRNDFSIILWSPHSDRSKVVIRSMNASWKNWQKRESTQIHFQRRQVDNCVLNWWKYLWKRG